MFHNALHFINTSEKMLKSLNNNTSPFSMENLLSREKLSPQTSELSEDTESNFKFPADERKPIGAEDADLPRLDVENDRLSPNDRNEMLARFNDCLKGRICSSCGRLDCNTFQCRMVVEKDTKPVLKFSVSAILGTENQQSKHVPSGKNL